MVNGNTNKEINLNPTKYGKQVTIIIVKSPITRNLQTHVSNPMAHNKHYQENTPLRRLPEINIIMIYTSFNNR